MEISSDPATLPKLMILKKLPNTTGTTGRSQEIQFNNRLVSLSILLASGGVREVRLSRKCTADKDKTVLKRLNHLISDVSPESSPSKVAVELLRASIVIRHVEYNPICCGPKEGGASPWNFRYQEVYDLGTPVSRCRITRRF